MKLQLDSALHYHSLIMQPFKSLSDYDSRWKISIIDCELQVCDESNSWMKFMLTNASDSSSKKSFP